MRLSRPIRLVLVLVFLGLAGPHSIAQGPAQGTAQVPAQEEPATTQPTASQPPAEQPPKPLESFVPSEKVPADTAVAFPVDI